MKLTKTVTKEMEVFDTSILKSGDKILINGLEHRIGYVDEEIISAFRNGFQVDIKVCNVNEYTIEKVEETKLSKFKVGEIYKVTDRLSGDTYEAEVIKINREMVLERKSGGFTIVKESMIGNTLEFVKINESLTKEEKQRADEIYKSLASEKVNQTKEKCEKKTDEYAESIKNILKDNESLLFDILGLKEDKRPFFIDYRSEFYFKRRNGKN